MESMRRLLGSSSNRRILAVVCVAAGWFLLVLVRLVDLQVLQHEQLSAKAARQHVGSVDIPARRGHLIDRHGRELALSMQMDSIGIFSNHVSDPPAVAAALAEAVAVDEQALAGPESAATAEVIPACRFASVLTTTLAVNDDAFEPCSACSTMSVSISDAASSLGGSPLSMWRKFAACPRSALAATGSRPCRRW